AIDVSDAVGCAPLAVTYSAQNSTPGFPNGESLFSFQWTFPDNSTTSTSSASLGTGFLLTDEGSFTTTLVVTDDFGCVSAPVTATTVITKPVADFLVPPVVCDLEQFTATS